MRNTAAMNNKKLHVVFATSEPEIANEMLASICEYLPNYTLSFAALFYGQNSSIEFEKFFFPVNCLGVYKEYISIAESRNFCQKYLQKVMRESGGLGMILDDDLRWIMPELEFSGTCDQLISNNCDMAFCALAGDAPVPKEYTRASPLLDALLAISAYDSSMEVARICDFTQRVNIAGQIGSETNCHHDYYAYNKNAFKHACIDLELLDWNDFLGRLYAGKTTTRPVVTPNNVIFATGRERGGATLIFNHAVLDYPNLVVQCGEFVSRRSDMVMAVSAKNGGFNLFNTPAVLSHERSDTFDSHDSRKLIGDILGFALIESYMADNTAIDNFLSNLSYRLSSTFSILEDTSNMLDLLRSWLMHSGRISEQAAALINKMIIENNQAISVMKTLDTRKELPAFEHLFQASCFTEEYMNRAFDVVADKFDSYSRLT